MPMARTLTQPATRPVLRPVASVTLAALSPLALHLRNPIFNALELLENRIQRAWPVVVPDSDVFGIIDGVLVDAMVEVPAASHYVEFAFRIFRLLRRFS